MFNLLLRRLISVPPTLLGISFVVFLAVHLIPGDPARVMLGERATPEALAELRHEMGLDRPFLVRYSLFLGGLLQGNLGRSHKTNQPILTELARKFPATVELTLVAMVLATVFGIGFGVLAAMRPGSFQDTAGMGLAVAGVSMPIFWLGIILMLLFSLALPTLSEYLQTHWPGFPTLQLPPSGRKSALNSFPFVTNFYLLESLFRLNLTAFWDVLKHIILPAVALATIPLSIIARMTRACLLEVLRQDYIRVARAKGLPETRVVILHGLRNAILPIITVIALQVGYLLGGAVITEKIFSWPGVGSYLIAAVEARDFRAVQGGILLVAVCFVLVNILADLLYVGANPRLRDSMK